jgi:hypothetical protein
MVARGVADGTGTCGLCLDGCVGGGVSSMRVNGRTSMGAAVLLLLY